MSVLTKSLTVIRPARRPSSSTRGNFSTLCLASRSLASSRGMSFAPVMRGIGVICSRTVESLHSLGFTNDKSRFVMIPSRTLSSSTTGKPDTLYLPHSASNSSRVASIEMVTGSATIPDSDRFTCRTWSA